MHTFYIHTFGCQMNVHDSERMSDLLYDAGLTAAETAEQADLIVVNTCSVREKAEQKLDSELGKLKLLKKRPEPPVIAVAGCVARQRGEAMLSRMPFVDIVLGPDNLRQLPELALAARGGAKPVVSVDFDLDAPTFLQARPRPESGAPSAYVSISKGCNERCSFCIVPYTRGPERHRAAEDILQEVESHVQAGAQEVILLGQTVNGYWDPSRQLARPDPQDTDFAALLRAIAQRVPGLRRLRYTSPHPRYFTQSLIEAHRDLDVLCRHVHMPVQSGSDPMLRRMIRRHTREEYLQIVRGLRQARADMTFSTDLIVGFPGETDEDFEQTLTLMQQIKFCGVFAFKYSPRPDTPAVRLGDTVSEETKTARITRVFALSDQMLEEHLATLVGSEQTVLLEEAGPRGDGRLSGHTERNEIVHLEDSGSLRVGDGLVRVEITRAFRHSLQGRVLGLVKGPVRTARRHLPLLAEAAEP